MFLLDFSASGRIQLPSVVRISSHLGGLAPQKLGSAAR